jgi:FeS assembly protein SufD
MVEALLEKQKQEAIELVNTLALPSFIYGQGMGVNISELDFDTVFSTVGDKSYFFNEPSNITVPTGIIVKKLYQMNKEFIEKYSQKLVSPKENKVLAMHFTNPKETQVIIVPRNTQVETPIFINLHGTQKIITQNIIIVVEKGAHATIIEEATSTSNNIYQGQTIQLYVQENAVVTYNTIQNCASQTYRFTTKRASVAKDACLRFVDVLLGSKYSQLLLQTNLVDQGANVQAYTLYYGDKNQVFDIDTQNHHLNCNTTGVMNAKGALHDSSKTLYRGNIYVQKGASQTSSHQKSTTLLLSKNATCDAVPILDVHNDEVSCSHGASLGQVDEEELFYLQSRGLEEKEAIELIIKGMLKPFIEKISHIETIAKVKELLSQKMKVPEQ